MWQVLLAAAVAGSTGLVAKHFLAPAADLSKALDSDHAPELEAAEPSTPRATISVPNASECERSCGRSEDIFRFSSSGSSRAHSKGSRKKFGSGSRKSAGKKADGGDSGTAHSKSGRKFRICLKRRKTGKNVAPKCGLGLSKESSSFNYGLGVGIMYMMSTGKAEISRLNTAMDETAKVVKELKTELHRRRSSQNTQYLSSAKGSYGSSRRPAGKHSQLANKLRTENTEPNDTQMFPLPAVDDGEYASSVLTEEPEQEVMEMNQLEAELESELEKLPWSLGDMSCETQPYIAETEVAYAMDHEAGHEVPGSCQFSGVRPSELNQKLSRLLIEQQDSQITELETELNSTQSKLREKEAELQALKDCVRRLTNFSISNGSDDETDAHDGEEWTGNWDYSNGLRSDSAQSSRPVVGMKRPIDA
ncbi:uncharacterized protein LOC116207624 [Punica granatum]|uniref:Uncharacterized protein LOC116207624 n=1 Tax=Punica granatum TaxID=22663 RepID=A0A6P8DW68_PUNGR|nr:uncharacterized protein LOC116207624 [Punica granatum]